MFRRFVVVLLVSCSALASSSDEAAIRKVLDDQVRAWNAHDLRGFMQGYWDSPDLTFYSGGTVTRGWQPTLVRYEQRYQGEGRQMGTLSFEIYELHVLSPRSAVVYGKFHLKMSGGKEPQGLFTLVWRKLPDGWKIVHDHTSAE